MSGARPNHQRASILDWAGQPDCGLLLLEPDRSLCLSSWAAALWLKGKVGVCEPFRCIWSIANSKQHTIKVFGGSDAEMDQDRMLGDYVRLEDDIYSIDDPVVADMGLTPLDADTLLMYIQQKMAGQKLEGTYTTLHNAAHGKGQVTKGSARYEWLEMTRRKDLSKVGTQQADGRRGEGTETGTTDSSLFSSNSPLGFYEEYLIGRCTDASSDMVLFVELFITLECI
jgi:hypothetical protein